MREQGARITLLCTLVSPILLALLATCQTTADDNPGDGSAAPQLPSQRSYSSLIKPIGQNRVLWHFSDGNCNSLMLLNASSGISSWQHLPEGSDEDQDWSQSVVFNSSLTYTLQKEPGIISIHTRNGLQRFRWPRARFSWLDPRQLELPPGSRLRGPLAAPSASSSLLIMHSQGPAEGASSHIYAVDPEVGTLSWESDMAGAMTQAAAAAGLEASNDASLTDWMSPDGSGLIVTLASRQQAELGFRANKSSWGMAAELALEDGSMRWLSGSLPQGLMRVAGGTGAVAVVQGSPDDDGNSFFYGLNRRSGAMMWSAACLPNCRVQMLDTQMLLVYQVPLTIEGLHTLDLQTGEVLWHTSTPTHPSHFCGAPSLTSTDLVMACQCKAPQPQASLDRALKPDQTASTSSTRAVGHITSSAEAANTSLVCFYAVRLRNGKIEQEIVLADGDGYSGDGGAQGADSLPPGSKAPGAPGPLVTADAVLVALRRSVVAVSRGATMDRQDQQQQQAAEQQRQQQQRQLHSGSGLLWKWQLPAGLVLESWSALELHAGLVLVRTNQEQQERPAEDEALTSAGLVALDPCSGKVVWSVGLGPTLPPSPSGPHATMAFIPGTVLIDRCSLLHNSSSKAPPQDATPEHKRSADGAGQKEPISAAAARQQMPRSFFGLLRSRPLTSLLVSSNDLPGGSETSDVHCCLDAVDLGTGALLWSHCVNQGAACRKQASWNWVSWLIRLLLTGQALLLLVIMVTLAVYVWACNPLPSKLRLRRARQRSAARTTALAHTITVIAEEDEMALEDDSDANLQELLRAPPSLVPAYSAPGML